MCTFLSYTYILSAVEYFFFSCMLLSDFIIVMIDLIQLLAAILIRINCLSIYLSPICLHVFVLDLGD